MKARKSPFLSMFSFLTFLSKRENVRALEPVPAELWDPPSAAHQSVIGLTSWDWQHLNSHSHLLYRQFRASDLPYPRVWTVGGYGTEQIVFVPLTPRLWYSRSAVVSGVLHWVRLLNLATDLQGLKRNKPRQDIVSVSYLGNSCLQLPLYCLCSFDIF